MVASPASSRGAFESGESGDPAAARPEASGGLSGRACAGPPRSGLSDPG